MSLRRVRVRQGKTAAALFAALSIASACSSDSVSFGPDPVPPGNSSSGSPPGAGTGNGASGNPVGGSVSPGGSTSEQAGNDAGGHGGDGTSGAEGGGANEGGAPVTGSGGKAGAGGGGSGGNPMAGAGGAAGTSGAGASGGGAAPLGGSGGGGTGGVGNGGLCAIGNYGAHSYAFCGVVASAAAALDKCESLGMDLVSIQSRMENEYVASKQDSTWLGATDDEVEGEWRWASNEALFWDSKPLPGQYSNFSNGQPNNKDKDGNPENCLVLTPSGWNDVGCELADFTATCESRGPEPWPTPPWPLP